MECKTEQGGRYYCQRSIFVSFSTGFILNNFVLWRGEPAGSNHSLNWLISTYYVVCKCNIRPKSPKSCSTLRSLHPDAVMTRGASKTVLPSITSRYYKLKTHNLIGVFPPRKWDFKRSSMLLRVLRGLRVLIMSFCTWIQLHYCCFLPNDNIPFQIWFNKRSVDFCWNLEALVGCLHSTMAALHIDVSGGRVPLFSNI